MPIINIFVTDGLGENTVAQGRGVLIKIVRTLLIASAVCGSAVTGNAQQSSPDIISGQAVVVDADIIRIGTQRIILWGIDAPERSQFCYKDGEIWGCRDAALRLLETLIGRAEVTCYLTGDPDPFNRRHGVCESGDDDINAEMVRAGMALAYLDQTDDYADAQLEAIASETGLWQIGVEFEEPWAFRKANTPGGYR